MIRSLFLLSLCLMPALGPVFAQSPYFRHYTILDGLPSANVYECRQDSRGFMWISTETGVSRFDGLKFESFTSKNGLADDEIFGIREDKSWRIWFLSYNGRLSYYQNGRFYNDANTPILKKAGFEHYIKDVFEDGAGKIWVASEREGIKCLSETNGEITVFNGHDRFNGINRFYQNGDTLCALKKNTILKFLSYRYIRTDTLQCPPVLPDNQSVLENGGVFANCGGNFTLLRGSLKKNLKLPAEILLGQSLCITEDSRKNFWEGTKGNGLKYYKRGDNAETKKYLGKTTISHIYEDKERNLWISTFGDGLYFLPVNHFESFGEATGLSHDYVQSIALKDARTLLAGTADGNLNEIDRFNGKISVTVLPELQKNGFNRIRTLIPQANGYCWVGSDAGLFVIKNGKPIASLGNKGACKDLVLKNPETAIMASSSGVFEVQLYDNKLIARQIWEGRASALFYEKEKLWVGTLKGLLASDGKNGFAPAYQEMLGQSRITSIAAFDGGIAVGTFGQGVFVAGGKTPARFVQEADGLRSKVVKSVKAGPNASLWVAGSKGLSKLTFHGGKYLIKNYTVADGLMSDDVENCLPLGDTVFAATSSGLTFFDHTSPGSVAMPPSVYIQSLSVNGRDTSFYKNIVIPHDQNNLLFAFTAISFESGGDLVFKYKMEGADNGWVTTKSTSVAYPSLRPGSYKFMVACISKNGIESMETDPVYITIQPRFTERLWFRALVAFATALGLAAAVFWVVEGQRKKESIKQKIFELEQKALRAQMNPHFIFNAMTSIQQFINLNDKRSANRYLTKFADLMRRILDNSRQKQVSLNDEMEALRLYMDLEVLRSDNRFDYSVTIDKSADLAAIKIPPMLLQPYIENAILHGISGLQPQNKQGKLGIGIKKEAGFLLCTVEDNGIGRKKAMEIKSKRLIQHQSTAMSNIEERLKLMQQGKGEGFSVEIIDLFDEQGGAAGTKVAIKIPFSEG